MIIGLTGRNGSGKGTVAGWFERRGFRCTSLSDELRAWLRAQGQEPTRDALIAGGRALRAQGGHGVLATLALERLHAAGGDWVVDSIRNPAEVEVLREHPDFVLVEVIASIETRFARVLARGRAGDPIDFSEFVRQEAAELASKDAAAQQLVATAALADVVVRNDGDVEQLHDALGLLFPDQG